MRRARGDVQRLSGCERDVVHQERGRHARITRPGLGQARHGGEVRRVGTGYGGRAGRLLRDPLRQRLEHPVGGVQQRAEDIAHPPLATRRADPVGERGQPQPAEKVERLLTAAEAAQRLEVGDRAEHLRFAPGVPPVLSRVPRLTGVGMHLERQRLLGGQHLQQERQPWPEVLDHIAPELGHGPLRDAVGEVVLDAVANDRGRRALVRAHPQLRLGLGGRCAPLLDLREGDVRPPRVVLNRVRHHVHEPLLSATCAGIGSISGNSSGSGSTSGKTHRR